MWITEDKSLYFLLASQLLDNSFFQQLNTQNKWTIFIFLPFPNDPGPLEEVAIILFVLLLVIRSLPLGGVAPVVAIGGLKPHEVKLFSLVTKRERGRGRRLQRRIALNGRVAATWGAEAVLSLVC